MRLGGGEKAAGLGQLTDGPGYCGDWHACDATLDSRGRRRLVWRASEVLYRAGRGYFTGNVQEENARQGTSRDEEKGRQVSAD